MTDVFRTGGIRTGPSNGAGVASVVPSVAPACSHADQAGDEGEEQADGRRPGRTVTRRCDTDASLGDTRITRSSSRVICQYGVLRVREETLCHDRAPAIH